MKKTIFRMAALVLALVISVMAFAACSTEKETGLTKEYFEQNKVEVLKNSVDYDELFGFSEDLPDFVSEFGSSSVKIGIPENEVAISVTGDIDSKNTKGNVGVSLQMAGETVDLGVYYDSKKLALLSNTFLGENKAYGITFDSLENLTAKFDNSALAAMLGLEKGMAAEALEAYGINDEYLKGAAKAFGEYYDYQKKYSADKMIQELYALYESNYGEVAEETVEVNGESKEALSLEVKCDKQIVKTAMDWYIGLMEESFAETQKLVTSIVPEAMREDVISEYNAQYGEAVSEMKATFADMLDEMEMSGNMKVYIDKETGKYLMEKADLDITFDGENAKVIVTEYLADNGMVFEGTATVDGETVNIHGGITAESTDVGTKWIFNLVAETEEAEMLVFEAGLDYTKADGSYRAYFEGNADGEEVLLEATGKFTYTKDSFELTVNNIKVDEGYGEEEIALDFVYKAEKTAQVEVPETYVDILEMSEDELYAVIGRIGMAGEALSSAFGGSASAEPDFYDEYEYEYDDSYDYYDDYTYEDLALSYDDYEDYKEYYTYEEFCDFVDAYNELLAEEY